MTSNVAATAALAVAAAFAAWAAWQVFPERVRCSKRELVKSHGCRKESMPLAEIAQIDFHYHAVVGFVSAWEFVSHSGAKLLVDGDARGIAAALQALEKNLAGFSMAQFKQQFEEGDVEDSIEVWRAAPRS